MHRRDPRACTAILALASLTGVVGAQPAVPPTVVPPSSWDAAIERSTWPGGLTPGWTRDEMSAFSRDEHLLNSTALLFADARLVEGELEALRTGLLGEAANQRLGELVRTALLKLDVSVAREVTPDHGAAPTPDQPFVWNGPFIAREATPEEAMDALLSHTAAALSGAQRTLDSYQRAQWRKLPPEVQRLVVELLTADALARPWVDAAFDQDALFAAIDEQLTLAGVSELRLHSFAHSLAAATEPWSPEAAVRPIPRALDLVGTTDLALLGRGGVIHSTITSRAIREYREWRAKSRWAPPPIEQFAGLRISTGLGTVRILGGGDDSIAVGVAVDPEQAAAGTRYEPEGAALILDIGGNDTYTGRIATTGLDGLIGGLDETLGMTITTVVDLAGDDTYDAQKNDGAISCALFGIATLIDVSGADRYLSADHGNARAVHGIATLWDCSGDDTYASKGHHAQGAAHEGVAILLDQLGNDTYTLDSHGQGLGGTRGVGVLIDITGNDIYTAGSHGRPDPAFRNLSSSYAQGVGVGRRADFGDGRSMAGGWGVLLDASGTDSYTATVWAQGAATWWSVGLLADGGGSDTYSSLWFAQASTAHFSVAALLESSGNDDYNTAQPETIGQSNASARDGSIALFHDRAGNDRYRLAERSGAFADICSIALFADSSGDDLYSAVGDRVNATVLGAVSASPIFNSFRDQRHSLAVFLDTAGADGYRGVPSGIANDSQWARSASPRDHAASGDSDPAATKAKPQAEAPATPSGNPE